MTMINLKEAFEVCEYGRVKISKTTLEGKDLTLCICQEGELIVELALFQPNIIHTTTAEIVDEVTIHLIPQRAMNVFRLCYMTKRQNHYFPASGFLYYPRGSTNKTLSLDLDG